MKVKKIVAKNMGEALKQIRHELGEEALILNSKEIEVGGFLGFFTKKTIEVVAVVDDLPRKKKPTVPQHKPSRQIQQEPTILEKRSAQNDDRIEKEVRALKNIVTNMSNSFSSPLDNIPEAIKKVNTLFIDQDIAPDLRNNVTDKLLKKWYSTSNSTDKEVIDWTKGELRTLCEGNIMGGFNLNKKYLNLVGPTGVGKTTTIAKIAAHLMMKHKKRVAFITTDTFRIAAIEQLKTYAKILKVPVEVAFSIDDFKQAKNKLADYDVILVDSAGRNFLNNMYVDELKKVIDFEEEMETYLVLSLTSKYRDMASIYEQFSRIHINKVVFTKLDETSSIGAMVNLVHDYKIGVAYLTNGQNVPEDIIEGSAVEIANRIVEVGNV